MPILSVSNVSVDGGKVRFIQFPNRLFHLYVTVCERRTGPLVCLSLFTVMSVDKGHVLRFRVSKLPCDPLLIPNEGLTLISFKHRNIFEEDSNIIF